MGATCQAMDNFRHLYLAILTLPLINTSRLTAQSDCKDPLQYHCWVYRCFAQPRQREVSSLLWWPAPDAIGVLPRSRVLHQTFD